MTGEPVGPGDRVLASSRYRILFVALLVLQVVSLYWPRPPSLGSGFPWDKVIHFLLFASAAAAGRAAGWGVPALVALLAGHAVISELIQAWVPALGRGGDVVDLLTDWLGVLIGLAAGAAVVHRGRRTRDAP